MFVPRCFLRNRRNGFLVIVVLVVAATALVDDAAIAPMGEVVLIEVLVVL